MTKGIIATLSMLTMTLVVNAQEIKSKKNIDNLCGCFEVEFKYAETFSPDPAYKYHEKEEINGGLELILPVEVSDKKMVLQHLLVVTDSMVIKHWREDWSYENPVIYKYQGNKTWKKETLNPDQVKGKWTQSIWEVSDEPRYQGYSSWINIDDKIVWKSTTDAPLPRREYSVRSDYNILRRTNTISFNEQGWLHEQDNKKIIREGNKEKLLVEEKGYNSYKKVADEQCAVAKNYWEKNKAYWIKVRAAWEKYITTHDIIELKTKVEGKVLHEYLNVLAKDYATGKIATSEIDAQITTLIEKFTGHDKTVALHQ